MNQRTKNLIISIILATVITVLCAFDVLWPDLRRFDLLNGPEMWLEDLLFQRAEAVPSDIVIIGIDENDLDEFGYYNSWDRSIMARALEVLASDPERRPAVVAIDTMYAGNIEGKEESDLRLAKAAEELGNVITATEATFGTRRIFGSASVIIDDFAVQKYEEPYDELRRVTTQGHINTMYDDDGVVRHAMLYVEPDGKRVYSMQFEAARAYALSKGYDVEMPETSTRGYFYVPFIGKPGDFYDGVNMSMLINGKVDPSYYAGKLVLIGPYTTGLQDSYNTPIDKGKMMYGVEYQANVIQCILDGRYKTYAPDYFQIGALWICCVAFFVFCNNRKLRFTVPALIIGEILAVGSAMLLYSVGYITHALWIPLGFFLLFIVSVAGNYIRAAIARQNVTRTFERYVAPNIVGEILKEGTDSLKLGGKLCDIAVLFVDIRGFTTMSERLSPEEVVHILNQYLSMTSSCIERHQGTLDKFVGDATMAFWGAPIADDDPIYHAALTAIDIIKGADELSEKLKREINEEIHVGVGINYGPAVVGNMGSERRMDYTAIGDTVNTAARLEANAPGGTTYISRSVADALKGRMKFEPLDKPIKLKGKADGFEILKLIGPEEE
ncbi:CHASE2 domain-containing protein [Butyrivibrio sp. AE2032]|uniref:CHASE2 domain-containing protein n=1 Tax=Butyrivibrio sp. AE2032 TaxID=1458463 RepID=UPI00068D7C5F|nr:adenylate/guanylate cyclase domain-containing protein [Butyrivibrio sp. AE2032]